MGIVCVVLAVFGARSVSEGDDLVVVWWLAVVVCCDAYESVLAGVWDCLV